MARKEVVEVTCDRCGKTEHVSDLRRLEKNRPPEIKLAFYDVTEGPKEAQAVSVYDDLCTKCQGVVKNYINRIRHYEIGGGEEEPPVTPPPVSS